MFKNIKEKVQQQFAILSQYDLFKVDLDKDILWNTYLDSFSDPVERQSHNCNCCKSFIRNYAGIVAIIDNEIKTLWGFEVNYPYNDVPVNLHSLIKEAAIKQVFLSKEKVLGTDFNLKVIDKDNIIRYEHFSLELPANKLLRRSESIETVNSELVSTKNVFKRSLNEITLDSVDTVLELIAQNSLYRGEEFEAGLVKFKQYKVDYIALGEISDVKYDELSESEKAIYRLKDSFSWSNFKQGGKIRNTSIGTLLIDLSEGMELDRAVTRFETMVAPSNYKRPTALVTKAMIEKAEQEIKDLRLEQSLYRRYAVPQDIPVSKVLFVDRNVVEKELTLFEGLKEEVNQVNPKTLSKVEEITIDTFLNDVVPTATGIEILLEGKQQSNFMSLIAPVNADAPVLFPWDNGISWDYVGNVADSMKERVKAAGGKVEGALRFSIQWNDDGDNNIDFDAHAIEPDRNEICFHNCRKGRSFPEKSRLTGQLDVDIQNPMGKVAVENIIWDNEPIGVTTLFVHNYASSTSKKGFSAEIEFNGQLFEYNYNQPLRGGEKVLVARIEITSNGELTVLESLDSKVSGISREIWGIDTNKFHKVSMILNSPNHWDKPIGNRHTFFIIDKVKNPDSPRGIFNEFLKPELLKHKRVFELLGSKMKVADSEQQLSGLGFSSTKRAEVICRVSGKFTRLVKVKF